MVPLLKISGTPHEMGFKLGRKAQKFIRAGADFYERNWRKLTGLPRKKSWQLLQPSLKLTQKLLPRTFDEIQGTALGAAVPWQNLFTINAMEVLERFRPREKCTSILTRRGGKIFLAHNEDWIWADRRWLYAIHAQPKGEPAFLTFTYGAWFPGYGLNSMGVAYVADSLQATDMRRGLPQALIGREILRAHTLKDAVLRVKHLPHADGYGYVIASRAGEGIVFEATAKRFHAIVHESGSEPEFLVHTNFYQAPALRKYERGPRTYARFRYFQTHNLLLSKNALLPNNRDRVQLTTRLFRVLGSHLNYPQSTCCHSAEVKNDPTEDQTIASFMINPSARAMYLKAGNPCRGRVQKFSL